MALPAAMHPNGAGEPDGDCEAGPAALSMSAGGSKTARWVLSEDVRARMESVYSKQKFPSMALRENLAKELEVTLRQVQVWFQNRRQRDERQLRDSSRWNQWNSHMHYPPASHFPPGMPMPLYPGMMGIMGYPGYPGIPGYPPPGYPSPASMAAAAAYQQHPHIAAALAAQQSAAAAAHAAMYAAAPGAHPPTADPASSIPLAAAPNPSYMAALAAAAAHAAAASPYAMPHPEGLSASAPPPYGGEAQSYVQQQEANASAAAEAALTLAGARSAGGLERPLGGPPGGSEPYADSSDQEDQENFSRQPTEHACATGACISHGTHEAIRRAPHPDDDDPDGVEEDTETTPLSTGDADRAYAPVPQAACGWSTRGYPDSRVPLRDARASPSGEQEHRAPDDDSAHLRVKRRRTEEPSPYPPAY